MAGQTYRPGPKKPKPKPKKKGFTYRGEKTNHQTDGLPGYPAIDLFHDPGTPFLAPERGRIVRISGHPGTHSGNVYGESIYFKGVSGRTYFVTHLQNVSPIGSYQAGAKLGEVTLWSTNPRSSHAHVGINTSGASPGYGDTRTTGSPRTSSPGGSPTGTPNQPTLMGASSVAGYPPPNDPGIPQPPMPELPGTAYVSPHDPSEAWKMIASQPLSSPEAQRWAGFNNGR
jgi:hypothetical protein